MNGISEEQWQELRAHLTWEVAKNVNTESLPPNTGPLVCRFLRSDSLYVKETTSRDGTTTRELGRREDFPELASEA